MSRRRDETAILGDVLNRYDKLMTSDSFDSRDFNTAPSKPPRGSRKPRRAPSQDSSLSMSAFDNKSSRKAKAWSSMVRSVGMEMRNKLLDNWGDDPRILESVDSIHKWSRLLDELEMNAAARDDFLMLLQMMQDRNATINGISMKKIACEVGVHHLRRMLGLVPAGGAAALLGGMGGSRMPPPGPPPPPHPGMGPMGLDGPPDLVPPNELYSGLKQGIDRIQDAHVHLSLQNLENAARKTDAERGLFAEMMRRNDELKATTEELKIERIKLAKENSEQRQKIDQLQNELKIANEVADQQSTRSRETEEATKRELQCLDAGIRELEAKLADISQKNAVLTEEKESYKSHNEALIKEVERQDKVIRKLGRQVDTFAAVNADFANMVEPLFKLIRGLRERLDEYDVMRERLCNNIRDIRDDKEYAYRVGDLVVEMTTSRLWRIMEQYTDNNGRLHCHIEELQDMTRLLDRAMHGLSEEVHRENVK